MIKLAYLPHHQKVLVVGVSGGPDSLCLLDLLRREASRKLIVAHFNHKLRPEADSESNFVRKLTEKWGLDFVTTSDDVRSYGHTNGYSLEEAARKLRYTFLFRIARDNDADGVAVAHNADDQVETLLLHLLRGTGLTGLKGMSPEGKLPEFDPNIPLFRPLLGAWRTEIEEYCILQNLEPIRDVTNNDNSFLRNRIRNILIPDLENYNPRIKHGLLHTAQGILGDWELVHQIVEEAWNSGHVTLGDGWVSFDHKWMKTLSPALQSHIFRMAGEVLCPKENDFGYDASERVLSIIHSSQGKKIDFANGLYFVLEDSRIYCATKEAVLPCSHWPQVCEGIELEGDQVDLNDNWILHKELKAFELDANSKQGGSDLMDNHLDLDIDPWSAWLDADLVENCITIRPQRPGEHFAPYGLHGKTTKLHDFFINKKVPQRARKNWPLICAGEQVAWIPGYGISHFFRVTPGTRQILCLRVEKRSGCRS